MTSKKREGYFSSASAFCLITVNSEKKKQEGMKKISRIDDVHTTHFDIDRERDRERHQVKRKMMLPFTSVYVE